MWFFEENDPFICFLNFIRNVFLFIVFITVIILNRLIEEACLPSSEENFTAVKLRQQTLPIDKREIGNAAIPGERRIHTSSSAPKSITFSRLNIYSWGYILTQQRHILFIWAFVHICCELYKGWDLFLKTASYPINMVSWIQWKIKIIKFIFVIQKLLKRKKWLNNYCSFLY